MNATVQSAFWFAAGLAVSAAVLLLARGTPTSDAAPDMIAKGLARPYHGERRRSWCATT